MERSQRIPLAVVTGLLILTIAALGKAYMDKRKMATALRQYASAGSAESPDMSLSSESPGEGNLPEGAGSQASGPGGTGRRRGRSGAGSEGQPSGMGFGGGQPGGQPEGAQGPPGQGGGPPGGSPGGPGGPAGSPGAQQMMQGFMRNLQERRQRGADVGPALQKAEAARQAYESGDRQKAASLFREATGAMGSAGPARGGSGRAGGNRPRSGGGPQRGGPAGAPPQGMGGRNPRSGSRGFQMPAQPAGGAGGRQPAGENSQAFRLGPQLPSAGRPQNAELLRNISQARATIENAKVAVRENNQGQLQEILSKALNLLAAQPAATMPAGPPGAFGPSEPPSGSGGRRGFGPAGPPAGGGVPEMAGYASLGEQVQAAVFDSFDAVRDLSPDEYQARRSEICTGLLAGILMAGRGGFAMAPGGPQGGMMREPRVPPQGAPAAYPPEGKAFPALQRPTTDSVRGLFALLDPVRTQVANAGEDMTQVDALLGMAREAFHAGRATDAYDLLRETALLLGFREATEGPAAP